MEQLPLGHAVQAFPDAVAYQDSLLRVTYQQLHDDVTRRCRQLQAESGISGRNRIAWCPRNDYPTLVDLWGIIHAGGVACPISHRMPVARREQVVRQLGARWLDACLGDASVDMPPPIVDPSPTSVALRSPATIVMSSGSSGEPKAVVHAMDSHIASARGAASRIPLQLGDGWLWALPVFHVGGLSIPMRCALMGATVCGVGTPPSDLANLVTRPSVTHVSLVPTQLRRLLDANVDLSHVKAVLLGGMAAPEQLLRAAIQRGLPVHTTYGMTEMASQVTTSDALQEPTTSSGALLPGQQLRVAANGEILVRGESLCLGYAKGDRIDSVTDDEGWFRTGDRGRWLASGELEVLGRIDNMFVSGGENVYPEAIEAALLKLPGIRQAVVVPRPDAEFGHRPVAFVQLDQHQAITREHAFWSRQLRTSLAGFEIPVAYFAWPAEAELAIKPDRSRLKELAAEGKDRL